MQKLTFSVPNDSRTPVITMLSGKSAVIFLKERNYVHILIALLTFVVYFTVFSFLLSVLHDKVLFSAKMNPSNKLKNGILQYSNVITNVGGAYNPADSTFTAPMEGYYVFSWSTSTYDRKYTVSSIMKNGARTVSQSAYAGAVTNQGDSTSETAVLHLVQGDRVWINLYQGEAPYMDGAAYSTYRDINVFTGFLL